MSHKVACGVVERDPFVVRRCRRGSLKRGKVRGTDVPYRKLHTSQINQ